MNSPITEKIPGRKPRCRRGIASRVKANRIDSLQEESQEREFCGEVSWIGLLFILSNLARLRTCVTLGPWFRFDRESSQSWKEQELRN